MGSIADSLKDAKPEPHSRTIEYRLSQLDAADKKAVVAVLTDSRKWTTAGASRALTHAGFKIGDSAVARWRRNNEVSDS